MVWDVDGEQWLGEDQFIIHPNGQVSAWCGEDPIENRVVEWLETVPNTGELQKPRHTSS